MLQRRLKMSRLKMKLWEKEETVRMEANHVFPFIHVWCTQWCWAGLASHWSHTWWRLVPFIYSLWLVQRLKALLRRPVDLFLFEARRLLTLPSAVNRRLSGCSLPWLFLHSSLPSWLRLRPPPRQLKKCHRRRAARLWTCLAPAQQRPQLNN